jgi:hypothetical protein
MHAAMCIMLPAHLVHEPLQSVRPYSTIEHICVLQLALRFQLEEAVAHLVHKPLHCINGDGKPYT